MENTILSETQQPGVDFVQGFPDWTQLNSPVISQGLIDAFLNQGYVKVFEDTEDLEPYLVTASQLSVAYPANPGTGNTVGWTYPIIPATGGPWPDCIKVAQIGYAPQGLVYTQWYERAVDFLGYQEWIAATGYGYMQAFSTSTLPAKVAVSDDRRNIVIYPASASAGDTLFVKYVPRPTAGANFVPTLVNEADKTVLGGSADLAIVSFALSRIWNKLRAPQMALSELSKYRAHLRDYRANYRRSSHASDLRVRMSSFPTIGVDDV